MGTVSGARERLVSLRHAIARIEGRPVETLEAPAHKHAPPDEFAAIAPAPVEHRPDLIQTGITAFDMALGGGVRKAALTELRATQTRHGASLIGFALCLMHRAIQQDAQQNRLPLLWLTTAASANETGQLYLPGIAGLIGIAPGQLFTATAPRTTDALWIAEAAAASGAFSGLIVEFRGNSKELGLDETRRLQRRAALSGTPVFLLRVAGEAQPTAAACRLLVAPAPAALRATRTGPVPGTIGAPAFTITIEKARAQAAPPFILEWNHHDQHFRTPHSGTRAATSFDRPDRPPALGPQLAAARAS